MGIVEIDSEIIPTKENKYIPASVGALKEVKGTVFSTTVEVINRKSLGKVYYSRENKGEEKVHIHLYLKDPVIRSKWKLATMILIRSLEIQLL